MKLFVLSCFLIGCIYAASGETIVTTYQAGPVAVPFETYGPPPPGVPQPGFAAVEQTAYTFNVPKDGPSAEAVIIPAPPASIDIVNPSSPAVVIGGIESHVPAPHVETSYIYDIPEHVSVDNGPHVGPVVAPVPTAPYVYSIPTTPEYHPSVGYVEQSVTVNSGPSNGAVVVPISAPATPIETSYVYNIPQGPEYHEPTGFVGETIAVNGPFAETFAAPVPATPVDTSFVYDVPGEPQYHPSTGFIQQSITINKRPHDNAAVVPIPAAPIETSYAYGIPTGHEYHQPAGFVEETTNVPHGGVVVVPFPAAPVEAPIGYNFPQGPEHHPSAGYVEQYVTIGSGPNAGSAVVPIPVSPVGTSYKYGVPPTPVAVVPGQAIVPSVPVQTAYAYEFQEHHPQVFYPPTKVPVAGPVDVLYAKPVQPVVNYAAVAIGPQAESGSIAVPAETYGVPPSETVAVEQPAQIIETSYSYDFPEHAIPEQLSTVLGESGKIDVSLVIPKQPEIVNVVEKEPAAPLVSEFLVNQPANPVQLVETKYAYDLPEYVSHEPVTNYAPHHIAPFTSSEIYISSLSGAVVGQKINGKNPEQEHNHPNNHVSSGFFPPGLIGIVAPQPAPLFGQQYQHPFPYYYYGSCYAPGQTYYGPTNGVIPVSFPAQPSGPIVIPAPEAVPISVQVIEEDKPEPPVVIKEPFIEERPVVIVDEKPYPEVVVEKFGPYPPAVEVVEEKTFPYPPAVEVVEEKTFPYPPAVPVV